MSADIAIKQTNQPIYNTTSEQKTSASDVSVWNNPRATESTVTNSSYTSSSTIEDVYNQYIKETAELHKDASEQDVKNILSEIGYPKEKIIELGKDAFFNLMPKFDNIFEHIYGTSGDIEQKKENIIKQIKYSNGNLDEIADFNDNYNNANFKSLLYKIANNPNYTIPENIKKRLDECDDIKNLTIEEVRCLISFILDNMDKSDLNIEQLLEYIFLNIPDEYLNQSPIIRDLLLGALEEASSQYEGFTSGTVFIAMFDKIKNTEGGLESACSPRMIENIFKTLYNSQNSDNFFIIAQSIIDSGDDNQKQVFANRIGEYLTQQLEQKNQLDAKPEKTPEEQAFLDKFAKLENLFEQAAGYTFVRAEAPIKQNLHNEARRNRHFLHGAYQEAYKYALNDPNADPINVTAELDAISDNEYSKVLTELGYELPTSENLAELRAKAAEGKLLAENSSSSDNGFGYGQQNSESAISIAAANAETIRNQIYAPVESSKQNEIIIEKADTKSEEKSSNPLTFINKNNLSGFSGNDLSKMISNRLVKFSDALKQYTTNLSESGKQFVISNIKLMDKGSQAYALNSTSNTARWEIMSKASLLDENIKVDFDYNHEKLREKYQA